MRTDQGCIESIYCGNACFTENSRAYFVERSHQVKNQRFLARVIVDQCEETNLKIPYNVAWKAV